MPRGLVGLLRRLLPPYGFKREVWVASEASTTLQLLFATYNRNVGFEFKAVPISSEADAMLGFVSAAADVVSQTVGGRPGGHGAVNATVKFLQVVLMKDDVLPMIERTMTLHADPTPAFLVGHQAGGEFANADLAGNTSESARVMATCFAKYYGSYCSRLPN